MPSPKLRVLLVEHDVAHADVLADEMRSHGHVVQVAHDGASGWMLLDRSTPHDVIVLDLAMPNLGGSEFRTRQLADATFATIPTVVMTGQRTFPPEALTAAIVEAARPTMDTKTCALCDRTYDEESWQRLRWVGETDNGRDVGERLELRSCECSSTLAWELGRHALSVNVRAARPSRKGRV